MQPALFRQKQLLPAPLSCCFAIGLLQPPGSTLHTGLDTATAGPAIIEEKMRETRCKVRWLLTIELACSTRLQCDKLVKKRRASLACEQHENDPSALPISIVRLKSQSLVENFSRASLTFKCPIFPGAAKTPARVQSRNLKMKYLHFGKVKLIASHMAFGTLYPRPPEHPSRPASAICHSYSIVYESATDLMSLVKVTSWFISTSATEDT